MSKKYYTTNGEYGVGVVDHSCKYFDTNAIKLKAKEVVHGSHVDFFRSLQVKIKRTKM